MSSTGEPSPTTTRAKVSAPRVSLACVPCRNRHIKCDATRPCCRRCSSEGRECYYAKSRRGGLDRAALAARRGRGGAQVVASPASTPVTTGQEPPHKPPTPERRQLGNDSLSVEDRSSSLEAGGNAAFPLQHSTLFSMSTIVHSSPADAAAEDPLVDLYYEHFHAFHPCVLPRRHMKTFMNDASKKASLEPLISVLRFIGSIFGRPDQSGQLKDHARRSTRDAPVTPLARAFMVQARLLLSIALYWSCDRSESREVMDSAFWAASDLGMFRREFATENGEGDPVLEESWRRTWWQVYIVDAYFAVITRTPTFLAHGVETTVNLPCEENEYESDSIPVPKTWEDYESREFSPDNHAYSSFAYLIGAFRCISTLMALVPQTKSSEIPLEMVEAVDVVVDGWLLLLPESKRHVMSGDGTIDELMFQAHKGVHAFIISLHRPFSNLFYNPLEIISSCLTGGPNSESVGDLADVHTVRCLRSVEAQIRLMALPARPFSHTPFVICMLTAGTIPLLSACKFLFTGERLNIARHQIRMSIGCLKTMAETWPQAALQVRELQMIAQVVLGLAPNEGGSISGTLRNSSGSESGSSSTAVGPFEVIPDGGFPFDALDNGLQNSWDINDMPQDLASYSFTTI